MIFLEKTLEVIKASIKLSLAYVSSTWATVVVGMLQITIFYYIWMAVYSEKTMIFGVDKYQIITYIILSRIIYMQVIWGVNLSGGIVSSGQIAVELLKPIDLQLYSYMARLGDFVSYGIINSIPVLIISFLIFGISFPTTLSNGLLFVISLFMATTISFFVDFIVKLITFYIINAWGLMVLRDAIISFFSGAMVPLYFFPQWLKNITNMLPFKDMIYTPISIYLGLNSGSQAINAILFQIIWIVILFIISRVFYKAAVKKVVIMGG